MENAGPSKMQGWKTREWKTRDHHTGGGKRETNCYGTVEEEQRRQGIYCTMKTVIKLKREKCAI